MAEAQSRRLAFFWIARIWPFTLSHPPKWWSSASIAQTSSRRSLHLTNKFSHISFLDRERRRSAENDGCELRFRCESAWYLKGPLSSLHIVYNASRPALLTILFVSCLCLLVSCGSSSPPPTSQGWLQLSVPGPSPRWTHAAVLDSARRTAVVFGGFGAGNEVWIFSFDSLSWTRVDAPNGPSPRGSPAAISDPDRDRMVVVGGWPASGPSDEVWAFSFANHTWSALPKGPSPRFDMGAATDGTHAWFYGGYVAFQATDELWQLDLGSN